MSNNLIKSFLTAKYELETAFEDTWEQWRQECNSKGEKIYYDLTDAVERGGDDGTFLVGHYRTRPCENHSEGHQCNPPRHAVIKGL